MLNVRRESRRPRRRSGFFFCRVNDDSLARIERKHGVGVLKCSFVTFPRRKRARFDRTSTHDEKHDGKRGVFITGTLFRPAENRAN